MTQPGVKSRRAHQFNRAHKDLPLRGVLIRRGVCEMTHDALQHHPTPPPAPPPPPPPPPPTTPPPPGAGRLANATPFRLRPVSTFRWMAATRDRAAAASTTAPNCAREETATSIFAASADTKSVSGSCNQASTGTVTPALRSASASVTSATPSADAPPSSAARAAMIGSWPKPLALTTAITRAGDTRVTMLAILWRMASVLMRASRKGPGVAPIRAGGSTVAASASAAGTPAGGADRRASAAGPGTSTGSETDPGLFPGPTGFVIARLPPSIPARQTHSQFRRRGSSRGEPERRDTTQHAWPAPPSVQNPAYPLRLAPHAYRATLRRRIHRAL